MNNPRCNRGSDASYKFTALKELNIRGLLANILNPFRVLDHYICLNPPVAPGVIHILPRRWQKKMKVQLIILSEINRRSTNKKYESRRIEYFLEVFPSAPVFKRAENFHIRKADAISRINMSDPVLITSR
jgi:hypothetical protein